MKILLADDEPVSRRLLEVSLTQWGHEVVTARDGAQAWHLLQQPEAPHFAILDWMMPELDGIDLCRQLRQRPGSESDYLILLTSKSDKRDVIEGLEAGADDYVVKPFDPHELRARIHVGVRVLTLQQRIAQHVRELTDAVSRVQQLQGLLPICSYCKKIRDDRNYWHKVESYISSCIDVRFSHGVCPECTHKLKSDLAL